MLISADLVSSSVARWKRSRTDPDALAKRLGEGDRSRHISEAQRAQRFRALMDQVEDPLAARTLLERIVDGNDLVGVNYLSLGAHRARSICRVHLRDAQGSTVGFGTGFLVAPGVLMTNHHVISGAEDARHALAEFEYEYDAQGKDKPVVSFACATDPEPIAHEPLDFCLVGVEKTSTDGRASIDDFGWLRLSAAPGKAFVGEYLTIIQHPGGERKQVCVRENKLLKYDESASTLWYKTDTLGGSSGSPVFNQTWQVAGLHHSGVPATNDKGQWLTIDDKVWDQSMDETRIKWIANEGIRISSILEYLRSRRASEVLAAAVLEAPPEPDLGERRDARSVRIYGGSGELSEGELKVTIPVRVAVRIGNLDLGDRRVEASPGPRALLPPRGNGGPPKLPALPSGAEAVKVDQSNYAQRTGYAFDFLGNNGLAVPLPKVASPAARKDVLKFRMAGRSTNELRYWNYTVVMNAARRLAFYSAANVDAERRPRGAGRDGDRWYEDVRIDDRFELGADFYGRQREFEADRGQNPFDRGHLTRRLDAQWGTTPELAKRNGDDSFHWTNCSPQHYKFNQGAKRWLGLEDFVIDGFAGNSQRRACVINGPVFDAPLSAIDASGRVVPKLGGKHHKDPTFGGVPIPKMFFKVVACARANGKLAAAAFLMSQEDLLATVDRIVGMPVLRAEKLSSAEARLYQVSLSDLAALTHLDFGPLAQADVALQEKAAGRPRAIERLEEIRL